MSSQKVDLAIVGAGVSGIAAAKFYLDIHPDHNVVLLEQDKCLGGVWSSRRMYEGFWSQCTVGFIEYSDMPMNRPPEEDVYYEYFNAKHFTQYLENYVDRHIYAGQTLRGRINFDFKVSKITKRDGLWVISAEVNPKETNQFHALKLIVASGLTSLPNMPSFFGQEKFNAPLLHQEKFGQSTILSSANIRNVTILGAGKSAADMVYASVKAGKSVSWIISRSGSGPVALLSPKGKGPYKSAKELLSIRATDRLSPSIFSVENVGTRFLHGTAVGRLIVNSIWNAVGNDSLKEADFTGREQALKGFEKLKPHTPVLWPNAPVEILNRADFWDTVAQNVQVYHADISELDNRLIRLDNGEKIPADALLCGTGWNSSSFPFFDPDLLVHLGLPHAFKDEPAEDAKTWARLEEQADQKIIEQFPQLAHPPDHRHRLPTTTPYRLYNGIAALHDSSIAFVGFFLTANTFKTSECQAIWATAYLDNHLALPSPEARRSEIARMVAWNRRRYLSRGELGNHVLFETLGYTDVILDQVGLASHRKGWFWDLLVPSRPSDLKGLKDEYVARYGCDGGVSGVGNERLE